MTYAAAPPTDTARDLTSWWLFALVVLAVLALFGGFVHSAAQSPISHWPARVTSVDHTVRDGNLRFKVVDVRPGVQQIGDPLFGIAAHGTFTLVTLEVTNVSDSPQTFDGSYVLGIDHDGGYTSSDREAQYYANESSEGLLTQLAAGQTMTTTVVFDLRDGQELGQLQVHDSVFSRGSGITLD
jgi:hypothetical protein